MTVRCGGPAILAEDGDEQVLGDRLAFKDVPEEFVAYFHIHLGKELRDG